LHSSTLVFFFPGRRPPGGSAFRGPVPPRGVPRNVHQHRSEKRRWPTEPQPVAGTMSEREQSEEFKERMQASKLKINGQVILGRANYQLRIEDSIRTLDKDVERLSRLGKTRIDALDDMERRLKRMRSQLKTAVVPTVTDRVAFDLYQSNTEEVENKFTVCTRCQRKILTALMEVHDLACARLQVGLARSVFLGLLPRLNPPPLPLLLPAERRHQVPGPAARAQRGRGGAGPHRRARHLSPPGTPPPQTPPLPASPLPHFTISPHCSHRAGAG